MPLRSLRVKDVESFGPVIRTFLLLRLFVYNYKLVTRRFELIWITVHIRNYPFLENREERLYIFLCISWFLWIRIIQNFTDVLPFHSTIFISKLLSKIENFYFNQEKQPWDYDMGNGQDQSPLTTNNHDINISRLFIRV